MHTFLLYIILYIVELQWICEYKNIKSNYLYCKCFVWRRLNIISNVDWAYSDIARDRNYSLNIDNLEQSIFIFNMATFIFNMGTFIFNMGTFILNMGTFKFNMGTFIFNMGTFIFNMGTFIFNMATFIFNMGTSIFKDKCSITQWTEITTQKIWLLYVKSLTSSLPST